MAVLNREISNLVKLARTAPDIDELGQELARARQVADQAWRLGELLRKAEPATSRESL